MVPKHEIHCYQNTILFSSFMSNMYEEHIELARGVWRWQDKSLCHDHIQYIIHWCIICNTYLDQQTTRQRKWWGNRERNRWHCNQGHHFANCLVGKVLDHQDGCNLLFSYEMQEVNGKRKQKQKRSHRSWRYNKDGDSIHIWILNFFFLHPFFLLMELEESKCRILVLFPETSHI